MTRRLLAVVGLVVLSGISVLAGACVHQPSQDAQCQIIVDVENGKAVAVFPVLKLQETWRWRASSTPNMMREYEWRVSLGQCNSSGTFEASDYGFGVSIFKFPGDAERQGSLDDLLREAQRDVWSRKIRNNQLEFTRLSDFRPLVGLRDGHVLVGLNDRKAIDLLFQKRPELALFEVAVLEPDQSYKCAASISYEDLQKE